MSALTLDEKKAALLAAGKKIKTNASAEDIEMSYLEYEAELEVAAAPAPEPVKTEPIVPVKGETFEDIIKRADPQKGDKDPMVIAWVEKNQTPEQFQARYGDRKFSRN